MPEGSGSRSFARAAALIAAANALFQRERRNRVGRPRAAANRHSPHPEFDATITLHNHLRKAGLSCDRAADAVSVVRAAVRSMRGGGWISVEYVGAWDGWSWLRHAEWVVVYRPGCAVPPQGPDWDRLREAVEETVRLALEEVAAR